MLKQVRQKWQKQIRSKHIETIKTKSRQKSFLIIGIERILSDYSKCSLVSGKDQLMDHQSHFDCQSFIVEANHELYRSILEIGVQNCKEFLLDQHLPTMLYDIINRIQDTIIDEDDTVIVKQSLSRTRVIQSVTDLLCLFSQEIQLIDEFNSGQASKAVNLLFDQLSNDFPNLSMANRRWIRPTAALINLFHDDLKYEEIVYQSLLGGNFPYLIHQYCSCFNKKQAVLLDGELQGNLIALYSYYLEYQQANYGQVIFQKSFLKSISKFIMKVIQQNIDTVSNKKNKENKLINNLLDVCTYLPLNQEDCLAIINNTNLYSNRSFVKLLRNWSEKYSFLTLSVLAQREINHLLYLFKDLSISQNFKTFSSNLLGFFLNAISNEVRAQEHIIRLWRCFQQTDTLSLIYNPPNEQAIYRNLRGLFELYCPSQL